MSEVQVKFWHFTGYRMVFLTTDHKIALDKVRGFLPVLQKSNAELDEKVKEAPEKVDIEHLESDEAPHIELSLAVGVDDLPENGEAESNDNDNVESNSDENSTGTSTLITEV